MFFVEYRTVSRLGGAYPVRIATVGIHKASSTQEASDYILRSTSNVEIVSSTYRPIGD